MRRAREEAVREEKRRDNKDQEEKADEDELVELVVFATTVELSAFQVTLDHYDNATYEALIVNEQLLKETRLQKQQMLEKAFELPDGRRVFGSEDGARVFDEFGHELDASVVTPEEIDDWRPKAEGYLSWLNREEELVNERTALVEYQQKLDDARERVKDGEITADDLKMLERQLAADMPGAVRAQLAHELMPAEPEPEQAISPQRQAVQQPSPIHDVPTF